MTDATKPSPEERDSHAKEGDGGGVPKDASGEPGGKGSGVPLDSHAKLAAEIATRMGFLLSRLNNLMVDSLEAELLKRELPYLSDWAARVEQLGRVEEKKAACRFCGRDGVLRTFIICPHCDGESASTKEDAD